MAQKQDARLRYYVQGGEPEVGASRWFALVTFYGVEVEPKLQDQLKAAFAELPSCNGVEFYHNARLIIDSLPYGEKAEANFVTEVEECAKRHLNVLEVNDRPAS
jgi:hypothetical protein